MNIHTEVGHSETEAELEARDLGFITSINGSQAVVSLSREAVTHQTDNRITVGRLICVDTGFSEVVGVISRVSTSQGPSKVVDPEDQIMDVDLMGELREAFVGKGPSFQRGVTVYPIIGNRVRTLTSRQLELIHKLDSASTITVGRLQQDDTIPAYVDVKEMLSKHFAVLGTTGSGKSCSVALLLQRIIAAQNAVRVFLFDPHNEYGSCFGDRAEVISPKNVRLPYWLFNFEEIVDVIYKARPGSENEVAVLRELIPIAKAQYAANMESAGVSLRRNKVENSGQFSVDTPVPYRMADLMKLLDDRMGKLDAKHYIPIYRQLKSRIEAIMGDPRYAFMFDSLSVEDNMTELLCRLFRIPMNDKPITIMELAGFPAEVVDAVVSVLCRMAFDLGVWSDGAIPMALVCEEAHKYVPADKSLGFGPTRKSISRIAKEGRKYGVYLGIVTQRPVDLDPTILSQCSTLFAMRMSNENDQAVIRSAVADAAAGLLEFLPSLGTREAFAFGEGVSIPTRLSFDLLTQDQLPSSKNTLLHDPDRSFIADYAFTASVVRRWRGASSYTPALAQGGFDSKAAARIAGQDDPDYDPTTDEMAELPMAYRDPGVARANATRAKADPYGISEAPPDRLPDPPHTPPPARAPEPELAPRPQGDSGYEWRNIRDKIRQR